MEISSNLEFEYFFTNKYYTKFFPENTAGEFKTPFPYLKDVSDRYKVALVGHQFTKGFYNIVTEEDILLLQTKDGLRYKTLGRTYLKPGYYPTPEHLTIEIVAAIFEINSSLREPLPVTSLPLLEYMDDGYVHLHTKQHTKNGELLTLTMQLSPRLSKMLGCLETGDCEVRYGQRHVKFGIPSLVPLKHPIMDPPYRKVALYSNICDKPLMTWRYRDITYGPTIHVNPTYLPVKSIDADKPIEFCLRDGKGKKIQKLGQTSIVLKFVETAEQPKPVTESTFDSFQPTKNDEVDIV